MKGMNPVKSSPALLIPVFLVLSSVLIADSPPPNTIPLFAERPEFNEISLDTFLMLSWQYFDVLQVGGYSASQVYDKLIDSANMTGMFVCISPNPVARWATWPEHRVARLSFNLFSDTTAFGRPEWYGQEAFGTTFSKDTVVEYFSAPVFDEILEDEIDLMDTYFGDESQVWFYNVFDEAPSRQWHYMVHDSMWTGTDSVATLIDDYIPNMYTQDRGPDSLPTLEEVDPQGTFSWLKHAVDTGDPDHTIVCPFGLFHETTWAGLPIDYGTFEDQVSSIESYLYMEYQGYGSPVLPEPVDNWPEYFLFDCYPFRQVGVNYLATHPYTVNSVSSPLDTTLFAHFEEGMDSTFITVRETALEQEREIPALYYPQIIGKCGGDVMWNSQETALDYSSYSYRIPTPQEFLVNCNIALMRDIRALIPYCMKSYTSTEGPSQESVFVAGFMDQNNIPFDAPYEEWVYTDRWRSDFEVIPPDSYPPFSDSCRLCDDFDPLWDLPDRPTTSGEQQLQDYYTWKFTAYGMLWNSMRETYGQIAWIAPEYTGLHWWEDSSDCLDINTLNDRVEPQIRLFNDGDDNGYAFYVNRNCYDPEVAVNIILWPDKIPSGVPYNAKLLDHSRRFLMELGDDLDYDYHFFSDTLEAGQARLVQFFSGNLPADIRITAPDITASAGTAINVRDFSFAAEAVISVNATFYNMGTLGASDVIVHLYDLTEEEVLDSDTISFSGLPSTGYECDDVEVNFTWRTDSDDIGIHILQIEAETLPNEPDTDDNSTKAVFEIRPRDYAGTILDDPWNMTEATGPGAPAWHTNDVVSTSGWCSTYSDSISGMFEGTVSNPSATNSLVLNTGGSGDQISTRLFDQFSMIAKAEEEMTVTVHWLDEDLSSHSVTLAETIDEDWAVIGPVDLNTGSSGWSSKDAIRFWLEFSIAGTNIPKDVRIGWIKLTE